MLRDQSHKLLHRICLYDRTKLFDIKSLYARGSVKVEEEIRRR